MMKKNKKISSNAIFGIEPEIIDECLYQGSLGDGILYTKLHSQDDPATLNVKMCTTTGNPLIFDIRQGHHWLDDEFNLGLALVDNVARLYLARAAQLRKDISDAAENKEKDKQANLEKKREYLESKALSLRKKTGRAACLEFAASNGEDSIAITLGQCDQNHNLLAGPNAVAELDTGEIRPGKPGDKCLKHTGCPLPESVDVPTPASFEDFMWESHECEETINFLQRYLGYCLTSSTEEQVTLTHDGRGAGGKGVLQETLLTIFGTYAGPIQAEMLMDQGRGRAASAPSPDIMALQGKRLVMASESDEGRRFSAARLKWLTGGDTLVGRRPHDRMDTHFRPTHKLMLFTNNLPHAPSDDFAFWRRIIRVTWPFQFVSKPTKPNEKKRDNRLLDKLRNDLPGILAWMIRGALDWQASGLQIPQKLKYNTIEYRDDEDIVQDWIDQCCLVPDTESTVTFETRATELYQDFSEWWKKYHSQRVPSMHWFGRRMGRKFTRRKNEDGVKVYEGVALINS